MPYHPSHLPAMLAFLCVAACSQANEGIADTEIGGDIQDQPEAPAFAEVATFPNGVFLENLALTADNNILFTSYFDKEILRLDEGDTTSVFATLDVHPVGIVATTDGYVVSAHGKPFTDQPAFTETNSLLLLTKAGDVSRQIEVPDGLFLNGLHLLDSETVLAADSLAGTIWAISLASGETTPWLQGDELTIDPSMSPFRPGANGLKQYGDHLFVSNSSRGTLRTVTIDDGVAGNVELFARTGPIDDFAFDDNGALYATTHGESLLRVSPDGNVEDFISEGCGACTSVAVQTVGDQKRLVVLTTGHLLEGGSDPAKVLSVKLE